MMTFSKTLTQTLPSKNPKNPENNPENWYVNEIFLNKYDVFYNVEKLLKSSIQWWYVRDR